MGRRSKNTYYYFNIFKIFARCVKAYFSTIVLILKLRQAHARAPHTEGRLYLDNYPNLPRRVVRAIESLFTVLEPYLVLLTLRRSALKYLAHFKS